jgi:hypothetical protein
VTANALADAKRRLAAIPAGSTLIISRGIRASTTRRASRTMVPGFSGIIGQLWPCAPERFKFKEIEVP